MAYTFAQVFTFEGQLSQIEFYSGKFSFAYRELWLAGQKHVTLLTGVYGRYIVRDNWKCDFSLKSQQTLLLLFS